MQNTILIHAPGRRQGRGALVLAYTALFALLMGIWAAIFCAERAELYPIWRYPQAALPVSGSNYGRWLRQARALCADRRGGAHLGFFHSVTVRISLPR